MAALRRGEFSRAGAVTREIGEPPLGSFIRTVHVAIKVENWMSPGILCNAKILRLVLF